MNLYRIYNDADELLYVGISGSALTRAGQHARDKAWWPEVATIRVEKCTDRADALAREADAVRTEKPRYNVALVPQPPKLKPVKAPATGWRAERQARKRRFQAHVDRLVEFGIHWADAIEIAAATDDPKLREGADRINAMRNRRREMAA